MDDTIGPAPPGPLPLPTQTPRTAKIVLIGSASTGKTSIRNRFFRGTDNPKAFSQAYIATIGADFVTKKVEIQDDRNDRDAASRVSVNVQLWDTAGQERFQVSIPEQQGCAIVRNRSRDIDALGAAFYRGADACILVYSIDSKSSFQKLESWYSSFVERCPVPSSASSPSSTPTPNPRHWRSRNLGESEDSRIEREDYEAKERRLFPFVCLGNKSDLKDSGNIPHLVKEDEVTGLLEKLCPVADLKEEVEERKKGKDKHAPQTHAGEVGETTASPGSTQTSTGTDTTKPTMKYQQHSRTNSKSNRRRRNSSQSSIQVRSISVHPAGDSAKRKSKARETTSNDEVNGHAEVDEEDPKDGDTSGGTFTTLKEPASMRDQKAASIYHTPASSMAGISHYAEGSAENQGDNAESNEAEEEGDRTITLNEEDEPPTDVETPDIYEDSTPPIPGKQEAVLDGLGKDEDGMTDGEEDDKEGEEFEGSLDGIKHFYTSAKTGEGIEEAFTYIVKRLHERWKYQDALDESSGDGAWFGGVGYGLKPKNVVNGSKNDSIKIGNKSGASNERKGWRAACC